MTTILYAQPYNIDAEGFYFRSTEEYEKTAATIKDACGNAVEEFEIQFIDGESIDCALGEAWQLSQCNFATFFDAALEWDESQKLTTIIAVGECGYDLDHNAPNPDQFDVQIFEMDCMRDLAIEFVEEGLLGDIPAALQHYIDYDAFARDLSVDYSETIIAGKRLIYRCA